MDEQQKIQNRISKILDTTPKITNAQLDISKVWCMLEELKLELDSKNLKAHTKKRHVGIQASPKHQIFQKYDVETKLINKSGSEISKRTRGKKRAIITPYISVERSSWAAQRVANDVIAKFFETSSSAKSSLLSSQSSQPTESSEADTGVYRDKLLRNWLKEHADSHSKYITKTIGSDPSHQDNMDAIIKSAKKHLDSSHKRNRHIRKRAPRLLIGQDKSLFQIPHNPTLLSTTPSSSNDSLLSFVYHKRWPNQDLGPKSSDSSNKTLNSPISHSLSTTSTSEGDTSESDRAVTSKNDKLSSSSSGNYATSSPHNGIKPSKFNAEITQSSNTSGDSKLDDLTQYSLATLSSKSASTDSSSNQTVRQSDCRKAKYRKSLKRHLSTVTRFGTKQEQGTQTQDDITLSSLQNGTSSSASSFESANTQFT